MTIDDFLKNEVDDIDADSSCIYLKLDKDKYDLPFMTRKSQLRNWVLSKFTQKTDKPKKNSQELETYKKAFGLACKRLGAMSYETGVCDAASGFCDKSCRRAQGACWRNYFLKEARKENV